MDTGLRNRAVIVAASSQGMGRATAEAFAAEGARVAMCARNPKALEAAAQEIRARHKAEVFAQALDVTELLRAVDPSAINELRDRGLLAYHLKDFSSALRDLQAYLQLAGSTPLDEDDREEHAQIWEHVKTLRRRVASLN